MGLNYATWFFDYSFKKLKGIRRNFIFTPELVAKPKGKKVLVLSPHFDDEILGCGGTLKKHIISGDDILVVYLTDGSQGNPEIKDKKKLFEIRSKESKKAIEFLGIKRRIYLREPEGNSKIGIISLKKLEKIIFDFKPDLIYIPWMLDNHIDHRKFNKMLEIIYRKRKFKCMIGAYEIWTPLLFNTIVDITKEMKDKKIAMDFFKSQLKHVKYDRVFEGLNKYRAGYNIGGKGYAEAFLVLPIRNYLKLMK